MKQGRVTITLSAAQWRALLRAADNGAWSGDHELMETMFPTKRERVQFVTGFAHISDRIRANYSLPDPEEV